MHNTLIKQRQLILITYIYDLRSQIHKSIAELVDFAIFGII